MPGILPPTSAPQQPPQQPALAPAYDVTKPQGMIEPGNLDPFHRKILHTSRNGYSTTLSFSIGTDKGETLIPQVVEGKLLTKRQAIAHYMKTGQHLGIFDSPEAADNYATALHDTQAKVVEQNAQAPKVQGAFQPEQAYSPPPALPAGPISPALLNKIRARQ